ncbi:MAG TPA: hypothetical protein VFT46_10690 [Holophagaceae bacterium]|nr:hypothetical protein [Holophagaceae bacterium]
MSAWPFPGNRALVWRALGWVCIGGATALTGVFMLMGPKRLRGQTGTGLFDPGMTGTRGSLTEIMGTGRMVLDYQTVEGTDADLRLKGVTGRLLDGSGRWRMTSPAARRLDQAWTLDGPLDLSLEDPSGASEGRGRMEAPAPALRWKDAVWTGLQPMAWTSLQGAAAGTWRLPQGWTRQPDGRFVVDRGGVTWAASGTGTLRTLEAARLWATAGFAEGHLEDVTATLTGGQVRAATADLDPKTVRWPGPLTFTREDGWRGGAAGGEAPRPPQGQAFQQVELRGFQASRQGPEGTERLEAAGARWTPAGLRLEGSVHWIQTYQGVPLQLQGPVVLLRNGPGDDLPPSLPVGHALADGHPVLTWGARSLTAPRMDLDRQTRRWTLPGPVIGRGPDGTFTGAGAEGAPGAWTVQGPVGLALTAGGQLRGDQLGWQEGAWTLRGNPATWTRLRERLTGPRILRSGVRMDFPEGLQGAESAVDGELTLRAGRGQGDDQSLQLTGGVACSGPGWRIEAPAATLFFGPGHVVRAVRATGGVTLKGRYGEGRGQALDLSLPAGAPAVVKWQGRVQGEGETAW